MRDTPPNRLAELRRLRGVSAADLAKAVHITRQTVYALEAGNYTPNLVLGLRLAREMGVTAEELFPLPDDIHSDKPRYESVALLPSSEALEPGQGIRICEVDGVLVGAASHIDSWYVPPMDGVIASAPAKGGKAKVKLSSLEAKFSERVLIAGCDPAIGMLSSLLQDAGVEALLIHQNSSEGLSLLKKGLVHVAGTHLRDEASGESNLPAIRSKFPAGAAAIVSFANSEEGIVTAAGNPKQIQGVADLTRKEIRFINREAGSGSRSLLDGQLKRQQINPLSIRGYSRTVDGHLAAAQQVKTGLADCCMATHASAKAFGLHFIPLQDVRYDFVVRKQHLHLAGIQALFDVINRAGFRRRLKALGGYDTSVTGEQVT